MQKQATHQEWARLKLIGRPLLAGMAIGCTPLLWVAVRPSPCLVHLYRDAELQGLFRFPRDPIFLVFGPPQNHPVEDHTEVCSRVNSQNDNKSASLMVITCDGHIWCLPIFDDIAVSQRPSKRYKNSSKKPEKDLSEKALVRSQKSNELDLFDFDVSEADPSPEFFQALKGEKESCFGTKEQSEMHLAGSSGHKYGRWPQSFSDCMEVSDKLSHMYLHLKRVAVHVSEGSLHEKQVYCVQKEAHVGVVSDANVAAFGVRDMVSVASPSCGPKFFQYLLPASCADGQISSDSHRIHSNNLKIPTCILLVSAIGDYSYERSYWNHALVSDSFYQTLSKGLGLANVDQLLLQGDTKGQVFVFPVCDTQQSHSYVFCDIQEPVLALLSVPYHKSSDMLMIIGHYGRLVAVAPSQSDSLGNPFLTSHSGGGFSRLFQVELFNGFHIRDWSIGRHIISACLAGYGRMSICSSSKVYVVDLFEGSSSGDVHKLYDEYRSLPSKHYCPEPSLNISLQLLTVPVTEVLIVVGKGFPVSRTNTRHVVALTARGRLLGLEISEHVLTNKGLAATIVTGKQGTWKSEAAKLDEHVKDLINKVSITESHIKNAKQNIDLVNLALSEIASSLTLTNELLQNQSLWAIRKPDLSSDTPPLTGFWCKLEIIPPPMVLPPEQLSFKMGSKNQCLEAFHTQMQHINPGIDVRFRVTLFNYTAHSLSSHWSIVLELRTLNKSESSPVFNFSSIINGGYGLPLGNQFSFEFCGVIPGAVQSPWVASVFLCHIHDQHKAIKNIHINDLSDDIPGKEESNFLERNICRSIGLIDTSERKKPHDDLHVAASSSMKGVDVAGAVCVLLARFRVDVLSLLSQPLQKVQSFPQARHKESSEISGPVLTEGNPLGPINIRFQLSSPRKDNNTNEESLDAIDRWKEYSLEDLLGRGRLSENRSRITACVPGSGVISLSLVHRKASSEGSTKKELMLSASSLPLGCLVRESLLWRLAINQNYLVTGLQGEQNTKVVMEAIEKMDTLINHADAVIKLWKEKLPQEEQRTEHKECTSLVKQSSAIIEDLLRAYRSYREYGEPGPS